MKSKEQRRAEAIERNAKHRPKYLKEAEEKGLDKMDAEMYADRKQGVPAAHKQASYIY